MMTMTSVWLILAAILPAAFFFFYIMFFDSYKPEPPSALLLSALLGGVAGLAVWFGVPVESETIPIEFAHDWKESLEIGFLKLAVPAEIAKWMLLCVFFSLNKYFDEHVDGIVYSVSLSMGYVGAWGAWLLSDLLSSSYPVTLQTVLTNGAFLIPLHLITGSVMGYFFGSSLDGNKVRNFLLALLLPILVSGLVNFLAMLIGSHWEFYLVLDVLLVILGMLFYTLIYKSLEKDGVNINKR